MSIERLVDGYRRFRAGRFEQARELYLQLAQSGQAPKVLFVACCDSRVDPATICDAGPGELFVVRNVANLVPPYSPDGKHHGTSAALEFAVQQLGVEHIVVMGHAHCGGARALLTSGGQPGGHTDFLGSWMRIAEEARRLAVTQHGAAGLERQLEGLEHEIVRLSLRNLMTFHWIRERVDAGRLTLHGWFFGIGDGILYRLDQGGDVFEAVPTTSP